MAVDYYITGSSWHAEGRKSVVEKNITRFWEWPPPPFSLSLPPCGGRWALGDCRKFSLTLDFVFSRSEQLESGWCASLPLQHLFCLLFTSCLFSSSVLRCRLPSATRPAASAEVSFIFSNKEAAHLISNELALGLVMWIRKPRVDTASSIRVTSSVTLGLNHPLPKRGVRMDAAARLLRIMGIWGGGASLKLSFAEQGN